ncbi:MAG: lysozyme inhibitor LprI family protein [Methylococcales bacterium]|nr:lysozyme inhibitor LprI family protein [Methylococcales bacterium]
MNKTTTALIGLAFSVCSSWAIAASLPREPIEQTAFDEGCDKNQTNMNICSYYDFKVLDAELNAVYRQKLALLKGTTHEKRLVLAQRAWLAYVEADCLSRTGPREESGTIWPLEQNLCKSDHFTTRIKLLKLPQE